MKVEAYLCCWNEKTIMPLVVKHYKRFCDTIYILDNHSTDGSQELAKELGCVVIPFGTKFFDDEENRTIKNNCWKGSNADFVLVADFDEILFSGDTKHFTEHTILSMLKEDGITIVNTIGWQIMSDEMPKND
jgi:hypothetical protein